MESMGSTFLQMGHVFQYIGMLGLIDLAGGIKSFYSLYVQDFDLYQMDLLCRANMSPLLNFYQAATVSGP